jgi:hypothetical protein
MSVHKLHNGINDIPADSPLDHGLLARLNQSIYGAKPRLRAIPIAPKTAQIASGCTQTHQLIPTYHHITPSASGSLVVDIDTLEAWARERQGEGQGDDPNAG